MFIFGEMKNNPMTKAEEIRLHNLFIKFKNEGKELKEIKGLLEVDGEILEGWSKAFDKAIEANSDTKMRVKVKGVEYEDGVILYNMTKTLILSPLEEVIMFLSGILDGYQNISTGILEKELLTKLEKTHSIFKEYFVELNFNENGKAQYKLNSKSPKIKELAQEAIEHYIIFNHFKTVQIKASLIKNTSEDNYSNIRKVLPYALKTLKVKGFEGIIELNIERFPIDTNWIFLIGENGYGKTTILKAIAIAFVDTRELDEILPESILEKNLIGIEYHSISQNIINNVGGTEFIIFPHLACYGPSRLQIQTEQTQNDVAKKSTTTYSLFNSDGVLLNIEFEMLIWHLEKNPRFDAVKQTFLKLIPYLSDVQVDVPKRKVFYIEKEPTEDGLKYNQVTFEELASGFRSILAMVGDMMIRLFKSQPDIIEPSELAGIVIIDEIDLHWHPKMQREIPSLLSSIFPKVQFIASTHSLVPLLGAPENSVLLKVNRTVEEGITVEKMEIDFQALSSDTMLRDIFDLEKYQSDAKLNAWERYTKLKGLIHFEKDGAKQKEFIHEREILGDKYNFTL